MNKDLGPIWRFPILILGILSLLIGVLAGLGRMGVPVPQLALQKAAYHGALMIPAFFGTLIGLERAAAVGRRWTYIAPLTTGLGGCLLISDISPTISFSFIVLGSLIFLLASIQVLKIQNTIHNWLLLAGTVALFIGNIFLFNGYTVHEVIYWWISFLLLTITGERLELSRMVVQNRNRRLTLALLSMTSLFGAAVQWYLAAVGSFVFAFGMFGIGIWLLFFDISRRTVHMQGLTRFSAVCMQAGYLWLLVSALLFIAINTVGLPIGLDSPLHAFFIGFVFSMVIGHAMIIFPAVTRLKIPYSAIFYLPLLMLQASLILRLIGDVLMNPKFVFYGGISNAISLLVFVLLLLWSIIRGKQADWFG